jgi:hypothetical protein
MPPTTLQGGRSMPCFRLRAWRSCRACPLNTRSRHEFELIGRVPPGAEPVDFLHPLGSTGDHRSLTREPFLNAVSPRPNRILRLSFHPSNR